MLHVILSTKCEEYLELLGETYEDVTGNVWHPAEFIERLLLSLDPDLIEEAFSEIFDV